MDTLIAYTKSGKIWEHQISYETIKSSHSEDLIKYRLIINPPISYYIDKFFIHALQESFSTGTWCIDVMGRNYGVRESVYVNSQDLVDYLTNNGFM